MVSHINIPKSWAFCWLLLVLGLPMAPAQARLSEQPLSSAKREPQQKADLPRDAASPRESAAPSKRLPVLSESPQHFASSPLATDQSHQTSIPTADSDGAATASTQLFPRPGTSESQLLTSETDSPAELTADLELLGGAAALEGRTKPDEVKKEPKSAAPLINTFLDEPWTVTAQATVANPANTPQPTAPPKPASTEPSAPELPADPELGVIQVAEVQRDDELGVIQLRNPLQDSELGILELRQISPPPQRVPFLYLSSFVAASSSDNVFLVEDPLLGRFGDNFIRPGLSITAFPTIGPETNLLLTARATLLRYEEQSNSSYDELRFQAGVRHRFSERVYAQLSLSHQLLYDEGFTDQFFTNTGVEVTVGRRDRLTPRLTLDSYYQGQVFFSDPERFSNVLNSVGAYLGYRITPQWDTGVSYRLTISDFTQQSRHETYQRITGQLRYSLTPAVRLSLFGGLSYGRSSESRITFDDTFFGISFDATVSIF